MPSFDRETGGPKTGLTPALLVALALCLLFAGSAAAAAPNWLEPADLSKPGRDASNPTVVMDGAGNTVALWERQSPVDPSFNLQMSTRAAGGAFTAPVDFSLKSTEPQLAMSADGEAVVAWKHFENPPGVYVIEIATRPPGGSFSAPTPVYTVPPGVIPQELGVAIGTGGDVAVTWSRLDPDSGLDEVVCGIDPVTMKTFNCPNPSFVESSVVPAGGSPTPAQRISAPRGVEQPGEAPKDKEEREKAESALTAGEAHPVVDGAGNTTVVLSAFDGEDNVIQTAYRPAGGAFTGPDQVSASGGDAGLVEVGVDAAGNAIATWQRNEGADRVVQAAIKAPGGVFASLGDISSAGAASERPVLDVAPNGTAILVWRLTGISDSFLQSSTRPPGGAFSAPVSFTNGKDNPLFHEVALSEEGDVIVVWSGDNGGNEIARAAVRPAGSAFGPPVAISQSSPDLFHPRTSIDASGNATVVWVRDNGTHSIVQWAGYDADPPQLRDVSIPGAAKVADTVQFSASAFDVWPVGNPTFDFGDGGQAAGTSASHAYGAPGSYTVNVTARDGAGRTATSTATLLVKARNFFTIGKLKKNRKRGTATLAVTIPEPGALVASGKGIKKATVRAAKEGTVKLRLKARGKGLRRLKAKGRLKAKLRIAYSPVGGDANAKRYRLVLQKRLG